MNRVQSIVLLVGTCFAFSLIGHSQDFDLVLQGGRVMDPESGFDGIRNVGLKDGKIVSISEEALKGKEVINASGLVVAPGFIDLHQHAWDDESIRFKILDGATSVFELEVGTDDVDDWYQKYQGRLPFHHGVSIGHIKVRMKVMGDFPSFLPKADSKAATLEATDEQIAQIKSAIGRGLDQGAVAVGFGLAYTPTASRWEVLEAFRVAAQHQARCHVHIRTRRKHSLEGVGEVIAASAITGAASQIVHLQATGAGQTPKLLQMVEEARGNGLDISAEIYPYTAGMTDIKSAIFSEGWQDEFGLDYADLQWGATGERLTEASFTKYRKTGGLVIVYSNTEEIVTNAIRNPMTFIASDGLKGHPRNAGTFARMLGYYVHKKEELELMDALRKISLMPARVLEKRVPTMKQKGRIKPGADADLTLFHPDTVTDRATFMEPALPSGGIPYVIVGGTVVVREGKIVEDLFPGKGIRGETPASTTPKPN